MRWLWDERRDKKAELLEDTVRKLDLALTFLRAADRREEAMRREIQDLRDEVKALYERQGGDAIQEGLEAILSYGPKGGERR